MGRKVTKIELVQVNFVPSWIETDDSGNPIGAERTVVGQLALDCKALPEDIQSALHDFILEQYALIFI